MTQTNLINNIIDAESQHLLYDLVKNIKVSDDGKKVSVPYYIEDAFDSVYRTGKADEYAYDGKLHDFSKGEWTLSGDNASCSLTQAKNRVLNVIVVQKLQDIIHGMKNRINKDSDKIEHRAANHALNKLAKIMLSTQDKIYSSAFQDELSDYGIESRKSILSDALEQKQFDDSELDYIKYSGYDYFIVREEIRPNHFIAPDDVIAITENIMNDIQYTY